MIKSITGINGILITHFEIVFASHTSSNISQSLIQYLPYAYRTYNSRRSQRGSRESRIAVRMCALAHRHALQIPCALCVVGWVALGGSRVLSRYTAEYPWGFPPYREFHPPILGGLCEILERDGRRPCREYAGKEKGKLSAILSGVCPRVETRPRVSMTTSFDSDQPEVTVAMRSTYQPEVAVSGSSAMAVGVTRERNEWGDREGRDGGGGLCGTVSWQKMRTNHAIPRWYSYGETHPTVTSDDRWRCQDVRCTCAVPTDTVPVCPLFPLRHIDTRFDLIIGFT